jgi:hypothetical protein
MMCTGFKSWGRGYFEEKMKGGIQKPVVIVVVQKEAF